MNWALPSKPCGAVVTDLTFRARAPIGAKTLGRMVISETVIAGMIT